MSYIQLGVYKESVNGDNHQLSSGAPGYGNGVLWPYNPNGDTPNFQINWNSNPPPSIQQIEKTYEALINWLQYNTGSPAFYNGSILFLQMTVDIGQHLGQFNPADQAQLKTFLAHQISTGGNQLFLQMIVQIAAQAAAVASKNGNEGYANATSFLEELQNATSGLSGIAPFNAIYDETQKQLNNDPNNSDSIYNWIFGSSVAGFKAHWIPIYAGEGAAKVYAWVDDQSSNGNEINGQQPITFTQFTQEAQYVLGSAIASDSNSSVSDTINAYYQTQIEALFQQFKGNPWALLVALMSLINQRDQDNGTGVNSYGGTLDILKQANGYVQKMLGDISGTNPNTADFYAQLQKLKALVQNDPGLGKIVNQFEADIGTINGQTVTFNSDINWDITSPGYYNFPPGTVIDVAVGSNHPFYEVYKVPPSGVIYIDKPGNVTMKVDSKKPLTLTFGQLAAMGNTDAIAKQMKEWENSDSPSQNGSNWSSTIMSNFENSVTGVQTLLNSPSAALQQEIQNTTQTMQAEENFEKEAFNSITNVNQQVMRLIQSVMG